MDIDAPRAKARSRTPSAEGALHEDRIVEVARRLIQESGVESVTMRRVAAELGVTAMALYRHVPDKNALLALVADAVIGIDEFPGPEVGPWYERIRQGMVAYHREIIRYPGLGLYIAGPNEIYPSGLNKLRISVQLLMEAGFDEDEALNAMYVLIAYEGGYFLLERTPQKTTNQVTEKGGSKPHLSTLQSRSELGSIQSFEHGLNTIIAGLRAQLAAKRVLIDSPDN